MDGVATVKTFKSPRSLLPAEGSPEVSDRREGHVLPAECGTRLDTAASDLRNKQVFVRLDASRHLGTCCVSRQRTCKQNRQAH